MMSNLLCDFNINRLRIDSYVKIILEGLSTPISFAVEFV